MDKGIINEEDNKKPKRNRKIIIAAVCVIVLLVAIGTVSIITEKQAREAVTEYVETYEQKLSEGDYIALSNESVKLQEDKAEYLSEEEKNELIIRSNYAIGLNELDFRQKIPSSQPDYYNAMDALDNTNEYGVSSTLRIFIKNYEYYTGGIEGTLVVPAKKDKGEEKDTDNVSDVVIDSVFTTTAFASGRHASGSSGGIPTSGSNGASETASSGSYHKKYYSGTEKTNQEKEEEKLKKYPCTGDVYIGFDKVFTSGEISESNIKTAFALRISLSDDVKEIACKEYEGIIYFDDKENFTLKGVDDTTASVKGSFNRGTWTLDFGDGIIATLQKPESIYSSSPSNSSSSKKDYSDGSDWENYDHDNDGHISDDEFQDATGDYIDDYFDTYGTDGDLNVYDYNGNGEMETKEFQDAVNDYMDENGY